MPTWPSPSSERLGTPKVPAIRCTRGTYFGASRFTYATACQVARPPLSDRTRSPRPQRAFTSRLPTVRSPSLPLDMTTTWTGLPVLAGLSPAGMAASLAAPEPDVRLSRIRLPPRVSDGKALRWPRVSDTRQWEPVTDDLCHPWPRRGTLLVASLERAPPDCDEAGAERGQRRTVGRHGEVVEVSAHDLPQPFPLDGSWLVHAPSQFLFDGFQFRPHAVAPGLPLDEELAPARLAADEGEAQEVEGLRLAEPALLAVRRREAAELDQAGLVRMQRQRKLP